MIPHPTTCDGWFALIAGGLLAVVAGHVAVEVLLSLAFGKRKW